MKNNPDTNNKLLSYLLIIKSFLVKFTFLAMIIKFFKRFSIIRRIWLILNTIVMSIFGISMLDIYGLSIISAFCSEILHISANIATYLSSTKFYGLITGFLGYKIDIPTKIESLRTINKSSTRNETASKQISKIDGWYNQEEIVEDKPFYQSKWFIYGSLMLISGITYYYYGTEISSGVSSLWNWLRGRKPDNPPINPPINPDNPEVRNNSWANLMGWNKNKDMKKKLSELLDESDGSDAIELVDIQSSPTEPMDKYFTSDKGKEILRSPSLDDLNSKVEETWSRSTSPGSSSSVETIKPTNWPKTPDYNEASTSSSSSNIIKPDEIPKSLIEETAATLDKAFWEDGTIKPFFGNPAEIKKLTKDNWLSFVNPGIKGRMEFIENTFYSEEELTQEMAYKMAEEFAIITQSYNELVKVYEIHKSKFTERHFRVVKSMSYCMRTWLSDYSAKLFPIQKVNISKGYNYDSPKLLDKDLWGDE
jgi:hypothetical protein